MITWMQKHRKYLVVTIWISTIAFVGAGFVGWGAYSYNSKKSGAVATVGNVKITKTELNREYTNIYNYYQEKTNNALTEEKAKKLGLQKIAFEKLVDDALLLNYAHQLGLTTLDREVEQALENTKAFQKNGVFNKDQYYRILQSVDLLPKDYENSLRKEITLNKLDTLLHLPQTPLEVETFGASLFMQDKLIIKIITISNSNIKITNNQLKKYWEQNKKSYLTTKSYKLGIIKIPVSFIEVDENESKQYYKIHRYDYTDKDGKIESFKDAKNKIIQDVQFKKGKLFALKKYLALKEGKITPDENVTITINNNIYPQNKLKITNIGKVLKPFKVKDAYVIAKLLKINNPKIMTFKEAKKYAKQDYIQELKINLLKKEAEKNLKSWTKGTNIGFVSRDDIKKIKGLSEIEAINFLNQVFNSNKKSGYEIFTNKAIIYKILEQKLLNKNKLKTYKKFLSENVNNIKAEEIKQKLIKFLENKYKITSYYKGL